MKVMTKLIYVFSLIGKIFWFVHRLLWRSVCHITLLPWQHVIWSEVKEVYCMSTPSPTFPLQPQSPEEYQHSPRSIHHSNKAIFVLGQRPFQWNPLFVLSL